jgi:hypothetical protein
MRRLTPAVFLFLLAPAAARADVPTTASSASAPASAPAPAPAPASAPSGVGLGVLALPGAAEAAWPLAQQLYAEPSLRPATIDEPHARVLCGEPPPPAATQDLRDLAETVAAIHGDDAPSRALLDGIAHRFELRGIVIVRPAAASGAPSAQVFLGATSTIDAASYATDTVPPGAPDAVPSWSGAVHSLTRVFGIVPASPLATHDVPPPDGSSPRHFYESGWFWGALGLAALAGGAVFFATRDSGTPTIHLDAQVPH